MNLPPTSTCSHEAASPLMAAFTDATPSLGPSTASTVDSSSDGPATPSDKSPFLSADVYSLSPPIDALTLALPHRPATPTQRSPLAVLPHILNPETAANVPIRKVCCIGAGYVGGPTAAVIALHNPDVRVTVVDRDEKRINAWKGRHLPIHEPGLVDVVRLARDGGSQAKSENGARSGRQPNLFFSTACTETIAEADMVLISVNTNTKKRGVGAGRATDMTALEGAVRDVAIHAKAGTILVEKSTVPCKTGQLIKDIMEAHRPGLVFPVLSNPEFLSEGTAIRDLMHPDRVVIGCESTISGHRAAAALANLYAAWVPRSRIAPINIWSSELCKLAANAMLAQRISSINSISAICERTGADVGEIAKSVGMDPRIGPHFLKAGLGFGGSCFRKDIASLTYLAESLGLPEVAEYWQQVLTMNNFQRDRFARHVIATLNNSLRGKKITILGYAFKKNTGDARESPALDVIRILLDEGPRSIAIFDPLCSEADIKRELSVLEVDTAFAKPDGPVEILSDPYEACKDSSAVLVLTDWDMFKASLPGRAQGKPIETPNPLQGSTPADVLQLTPRQTREFAKPAQPEAGSSSLPAELAAKLIPEPVCPSNCKECADAASKGQSGERDVTTPLNWANISRSVREPRWVFDGRGILDARAMISMGFRLETLGRASLY
ncbi:UDP-glucose 6-dehydrogenase [Lecanosticta acicola]|uniref:UDP-glucose 6-dehydrogenase n=1 Tax=Lecanosticta acicola TaxID=111012 RepID=A0AAI9EC49_9PEZI|nr:UDP-glucose 6-dehydrogenase [Lecanosticta acicola]